jgi:asparagine synthase (glutamine-hydrolysing)
MIGGLLSRDPGGHVTAEDVRAMAACAGAGSAQVVARGPLGLFALDQPIHSQSESGVWLVADLDLTNWSDLRRESGREASEDVLLALYERYGRSFVRRLHGGFAIVLWDQRVRRLLLAVDRFGIARLYYAATPHLAAFASRSSALRAAPHVDGSVDPAAAFRYLNFGYVPAPGSIYQGVRRVPPGHVLLIGDGEPVLDRYWDLSYAERSLDLATAAADVYRHTEQAVGRALHGTPTKETGAFLSGGTDSSALVGLMSRVTGERINAFSIGFSEARYDELAYAELTARHFGATHYTHVIQAAEALALLPELVEAYDEPFGNDSAIGTAICARFAAECGVRRLIAGDGGDEIFGGNERYRTDAIFALYHRLPRPLRTLVMEPVLAALPDGGESVIGRARRYVRRANLPTPHRFYSYEFHFLQHADEFLAPDFVAAAGRTAPLDVLDEHWARSGTTAELNRLLYLDMKLTIGDNDLYKVTRTAEMAGIRVAFPMLDPGLVEFMATLPARYKLRGLEKRYLFKRAFRDLLPAATLSKRKHGFGVPAGGWLRDDPGFAGLARDVLLEGSARTAAWFRPGAIERLFKLHADDVTTFYGSLLWTVLMVELWHRRHTEQGRQP